MMRVTLVPFAAAISAAAQPPVAAILAADPANGRIIEYVKDWRGLSVRTFASGAPLVEPVAMMYADGAPGGILVVDRGADAVWRFDAGTGGFMSVAVPPGAGGLEGPVAIAHAPWSRGDQFYILNGGDGSVRLFESTTGTFLGLVVEGRGRASAMVASGESQGRRSLITIAYPDADQIVRIDAGTGVVEAAAFVESPRALAWHPSRSNSLYATEDPAAPLLPDRVVFLNPLSLAPGIAAELPPGLTAEGLTLSYVSTLYVSTREALVIPEWRGMGGLVFAAPGAGAAGLLGRNQSCYADMDPNTGVAALDIFDFLEFMRRFEQRDPGACDCDTGTGAGVCDIFDFVCFQGFFAFGCP